MDFTKKDSFIKQIIIYFKSNDYVNAYVVAVEFNAKFPDDLVSNFLRAKACFYMNKHDEGLSVARKTFNISTGQDLITTAILLCSIYYMRGEYVDGYKLLESLGSDKSLKINGEVEELMTILSLALNNPDNAMRHIDRLYAINSRYADDFILRFFE